MTGVQTCALPIWDGSDLLCLKRLYATRINSFAFSTDTCQRQSGTNPTHHYPPVKCNKWGTSPCDIQLKTNQTGWSTGKWMVISCVSGFHSTSQPKASDVKRIGIIVRPCKILGGASSSKLFPLTSASLRPINNIT